MADENENELLSERVYLQRIARDLRTLVNLMGKVIFYINDAEAECPEKMRRFATYMHDVHDMKWMYETHGIKVPPHVLEELQRLDDRYRQLLSELNMQGGAFDKIRREMASDTENRWDHTHALPKPTHIKQEK